MAISIMRRKLTRRSSCRFVAATGASQFDFLDFLCSEHIDWARTEMFHLDEYVGISADHPASFRRYLMERIVKRVRPGIVNFIEGDAPDPEAECRRVGALVLQRDVDIAFVGIGENGHLAFNDPPADFETEDPYILVELDERCRKQQVGEGWFDSMEEVPQRAITMSMKQIMKARNIICTCPEVRKAEAVKNCLSADAPVSPLNPASILKLHDHAYVFLDKASSSLLRT